MSLGGYVVDCPHRERLGYGAEGQVAVDTALYGFDQGALFTKWLADWRDVQDPDSGEVPHTAPTYKGGGGPAWEAGLIGLASTGRVAWISGLGSDSAVDSTGKSTGLTGREGRFWATMRLSTGKASGCSTGGCRKYQAEPAMSSANTAPIQGQRWPVSSEGAA